MTLSITIDEIKALILQHARQDIDLSIIDADTIMASSQVRLGTVLGRPITKHVAVQNEA